ncbi:MAG: hypothetical protein KKE17_13520 [Proteobacteria bacterium]|nr:hypothetical protein [Pseudomonadota bacterium]MBU1711016.1 hypothetical protein [Pseudomonadota bacterium]
MNNLTRIILLAWILTFVAVVCATSAIAMTDREFVAAVEQKGLQRAIPLALSEGKSLEGIIAAALSIKGMSPETVLLALFQAGASKEEVINAAYAQGVLATDIVSASRQYASLLNRPEGDTTMESPTLAPEPSRPSSRPSIIPAAVAGQLNRVNSRPPEPFTSPSTF